jgi:hypothetical protein
MLYVCAVHIRCTHVCSPDSSSIDKRKNCQCWNSGMRQFRLLYICLSEQQHMTLSAPVHLSAAYSISSFFLRKKEDIRHQEIQQLVSHPALCAHLVIPTFTFITHVNRPPASASFNMAPVARIRSDDPRNEGRQQ